MWDTYGLSEQRLSEQFVLKHKHNGTVIPPQLRDWVTGRPAFSWQRDQPAAGHVGGGAVDRQRGQEQSKEHMRVVLHMCKDQLLSTL